MFDKFNLLPGRTQKLVLGGGLLLLGLLLSVTLVALKSSGDNPAEAQEQYEAVIGDALKLADQKQQGQAIETVQSYLADTDSPDYRYKSMVHIATFYMQQGRFDEALNWYRQAEQINGNDLAAAKGIALAAEATGESETAVAAYKKTIALLEPYRGQGYTNDDIELYEAKVKQLEEGL